MNNKPRPSDITRLAIIDNHSELVAALADVELYNRLKKARAEVERCEARSAELEDALAKAVEIEDAEDKAERKAAFRNFAIATSMSERNSGVLSAKYTITYEAPVYDYLAGETVWTTRRAGSFHELETTAYMYMMEFRTDAIPALIMALAPGNPELAMERYFTAFKRGFVSLAA